MQRYFLNIEGQQNRTYTITDKNDIHHIKNVMRQSVDDMLIINFINASYFVKITSIDTEIQVETIEEMMIKTELPVEVTIASGILKNDKYEWMVQKATELGAHHFFPFQSKRTIVKWDEKKVDKRIERLEKIVKEAAEQSYRQHIPTFEFFSNIKSICGIMEKYDYVLIAYEEEAKEGKLSTFKDTISKFNPQDKVLMIFGPEGGLAEEEVEMLGGIKVALGKRILRAETAPLYALSSISYHLE